MAPQVELLLWSGCPSHERARAQLSEAMAQAGLEPGAFAEIAVESEEEAERERFIGSPTVRIDGVDAVDPGDREPALTCRLYRRRDGSPSPLPDSEELREALARAAGKREEPR